MIPLKSATKRTTTRSHLSKLFYLYFCYLYNMLHVKDYINIDPEVMGGQPVFKNTRVSVETLFDHLENGITIEEFLEDFPTVTKEQAIAVLKSLKQ